MSRERWSELFRKARKIAGASHESTATGVCVVPGGSMTLTLTIPGPVVSWKRNRLSRTGKPIRDAEGKAYRAKVALLARAARPAGWYSELVYRVEVVAVYPRPKECPRGVPRDVWRNGARVYRRTETGPDFDRIPGNILDGLTDAGVWADDGQAVDGRVRKFWAAEGEAAHALVTVQAVGWFDDAAP